MDAATISSKNGIGGHHRAISVDTAAGVAIHGCDEPCVFVCCDRDHGPTGLNVLKPVTLGGGLTRFKAVVYLRLRKIQGAIVSLEQLAAEFLVDDEVVSERLEKMIERLLLFCLVCKNGTVEIISGGLSGSDQVKLVLSARLVASKLKGFFFGGRRGERRRNWSVHRPSEESSGGSREGVR